MDTKTLIKNYGKDYLLLDGSVPTLTLGMVREELILYNIPENSALKILKDFQRISGKTIAKTFLISNLSHGQKLILSSLIALSSNARKILFHHFFTSISEQNREPLFELIHQKEAEGKTIKIISE